MTVHLAFNGVDVAIEDRGFARFGRGPPIEKGRGLCRGAPGFQEILVLVLFSVHNDGGFVT